MEVLIAQLKPLKEDITHEVLKHFKPWNIKNKVLIKRGAKADKLFFINKGFALLKINIEGKQWVRHIAQPGEFITSLESFEGVNENSETIIAVGEVEIYYIKKEDLRSLRHTFKELDNFYTSYIVNTLVSCQNRINDLLSLDAEKYYEKLLREKGAIMNSIPQYALASYLGIRPQSLSRIRKAISNFS